MSVSDHCFVFCSAGNQIQGLCAFSSSSVPLSYSPVHINILYIYIYVCVHIHTYTQTYINTVLQNTFEPNIYFLLGLSRVIRNLVALWKGKHIYHFHSFMKCVLYCHVYLFSCHSVQLLIKSALMNMFRNWQGPSCRLLNVFVWILSLQNFVERIQIYYRGTKLLMYPDFFVFCTKLNTEQQILKLVFSFFSHKNSQNRDTFYFILSWIA